MKEEIKNRIVDKIKEIENYLEELESLFPITFEDYKKDFRIRAICERYFEKIIEAGVDLSFLFIRYKKYRIPEDDKTAFDILYEEKIISFNITERLQSAKGMRNIIAHEYGKIDDQLVFDSITKELSEDTRDFIKSIEDNLK